LLAGISQEQIEVLDGIELQPTEEATPPDGRRGRAMSIVPSTQTATLEVPLTGAEDAVVLVEQDGMYLWHIGAEASADSGEPGIGGDAERGSFIRRSPEGRTRVFRIDVHASKPAGPGSATRNPLMELIYAPIRAYVLKFAAHFITDRFVEYVERSSRTGLVNMQGLDPTAWSFGVESWKASAGRNPRILLFIHGTFSSTAGGFGALCSTPWGKELLSSLAANYDAVLGFDHPTLRCDPLENARDLLGELERYAGDSTLAIDVITHSRGGLVLRCMTEMLIPESNFKPTIGRIIMVGCPNGGTLLAEPGNWKAFIDLYTNLAVAACRLLSAMPQAVAVSAVLRELVKSVGGLLKYLATDTTGKGGVPGLEAMRPSGDFILNLNKTQVGQPGPGALALYAISSEFVPRISGDDVEPTELPLRFLATLAAAVTEQVMHEANDLVVNTSSMIEVDVAAGNFITDSYSFGKSPVAYHTCYFIRHETINTLVRWLRLTPAESKTAGQSPRTIRLLPPGVTVNPDIPADVDTDITLLDTTMTSADAAELINLFSPSYVVTRRPYGPGTPDAYYAFANEEVLPKLRTSGTLSVLDALQLHEWQASPQQTVATVRRLPQVAGHPVSTSRAVVMAMGLPVGVVPAETDRMSNNALLGAAEYVGLRAPSPVTTRIMPTFSDQQHRSVRGGSSVLEKSFGAPARAPTLPEAQPGVVTLHFAAEMPGQVVLNKQCTVEISLSREDIVTRLAAAAAGSGTVLTDRKILIQVIPKAQFITVGDDRLETAVPDAGKPLQAFFDLEATAEGEGEILVVFRQGQVSACTLTLRPNVVQAQTAARRLHAEVQTAEPTPLSAPLHQLRILDLTNGNELRYRFELSSPALGLLKECTTQPLKENVRSYVNRLYADIEQRWISSRQTAQAEDAAVAFNDELRAIGGTLFDDLIPGELQQLLWQHRNDLESIQVLSSEPFIPWEMVLLKEPGQSISPDDRFLAEMGLVRWIYSGWPPEHLRIRPGRARYVIPNYPDTRYVLPEALQEADFLVQAYGASAVEPQPVPVRKLLEAGGAFDLLHFACHASAEGDDISQGRIILQGFIEGQTYIPAPFDATTVKQYSRLNGTDATRPIVVLNACQAGRAGYRLSGIGGFAESFLSKGAGAFIGALWSVGDAPARTFTETFYKELNAGRTVAQAAIEARKAAKGRDATWLAYVVYAHPQATLSRN
jgi:hypothetical protein